MRLVIQRVTSASVALRQAQGKKEKVVGEIGKGLLVLVGIGKKDTENEAHELALKLSNLRIMADENAKMNLSVSDVNGSFLVVSQFTLHADTSKGNRPSFIKAAEPKLAEKIYQAFIHELKNLNQKVETGKFGEYMKIKAELDGPVTILINGDN